MIEEYHNDVDNFCFIDYKKWCYMQLGFQACYPDKMVLYVRHAQIKLEVMLFIETNTCTVLIYFKSAHVNFLLVIILTYQLQHFGNQMLQKIALFFIVTYYHGRCMNCYQCVIGNIFIMNIGIQIGPCTCDCCICNQLFYWFNNDFE